MAIESGSVGGYSYNPADDDDKKRIGDIGKDRLEDRGRKDYDGPRAPKSPVNVGGAIAPRNNDQEDSGGGDDIPDEWKLENHLDELHPENYEEEQQEENNQWQAPVVTPVVTPEETTGGGTSGEGSKGTPAAETEEITVVGTPGGNGGRPETNAGGTLTALTEEEETDLPYAWQGWQPGQTAEDAAAVAGSLRAAAEARRQEQAIANSIAAANASRPEMEAAAAASRARRNDLIHTGALNEFLGRPEVADYMAPIYASAQEALDRYHAEQAAAAQAQAQADYLAGWQRRQAEIEAARERQGSGYGAGFVPTAEGQEDYDIQVRILQGQGYSLEDAEEMAKAEFGPYSYSGDMPSYTRVDVPAASINPYANNPYLAEAAGLGLSGNEAQQYADQKLNALINASKMTDAEVARRNSGGSYYYAPIPGTGSGNNYVPLASEAAALPNPQVINRNEPQVIVPATGGGNNAGTGAGTGTGTGNGNNAGQTAADYLAAWQRRQAEIEAAQARQGSGRPGVSNAGTLDTLMGGGNGNGNGTGAGTGAGTAGTGAGTAGTGAGTGTGTGNRSGNGSGSDIPKGSTYFTPSYGQDMERGVKAPYRKGGYTIDQLENMGNAPRTDFKYNNGKPAYEGYYLAPDGHYYPVDQAKANYWRQNGGSYKGWEEGMRDYYKTFGTFYGYNPTWKQTGRSVGGGGGGYSGGGGGGYSYSGGSASRGNSGATANNGLYWNPNTSWSI